MINNIYLQRYTQSGNSFFFLSYYCLHFITIIYIFDKIKYSFSFYSRNFVFVRILFCSAAFYLVHSISMQPNSIFNRNIHCVLCVFIGLISKMKKKKNTNSLFITIIVMISNLLFSIDFNSLTQAI